MKRGMTKADEKATKKTGNGLAKTLLKIVGVGLAAGAALIAVTDKTMKKAFPRKLTRKKLRQHRRTAHAVRTRRPTAAAKINSRRMRGDLR